MDFSKGFLKRLLPAAAALALFFVVSALYFAPQFRGEVLPQHDVLQYEGMARDITDMRASTGEDPQWTGGMFGGMPAYLINVAYPAQLVKRTAGQIVKAIDTPVGFIFFAMTAMWCMLLMAGVNPWVGTVPALAYGLSTYFLLIIGAGHVTKMWALVYAPLMMGGAWVALRGNVWCGAAVTALAASLEIGANHPQITYYFLVAMAAFWASEAVAAFREGRMRNFALRTAALAAAGLLAAGSNFAPLWYTAQHSKETIRGGSELASGSESSGDGLALDYATAWSYGRAETLNLLVPDFMGRDSGTTLPADGETAALLDGYGLRGAAQQLPAYWGTQPYTGGPTYLGAAAVFLAALGIALAGGRNKWWIIAVCAVMILLAWGRNLMGFTELAFRILPGYDKFRTVSMTLVVVQWAVPVLGALALARLWSGDVPRRRLLRALAWSAGITGGVCLLLAVAGGSLFDFGRAESAEMMTEQFRRIFEANDMQEYISRGTDAEWGDATGAAMAADRAAMMRSDAWRSLLMILLAAGSVALFALRRIGKYALTALLAVVVLTDLVPVDLRFLSADNFTSPRRRQVTQTDADRTILQDRDPGYRVLNLTVSPFNDATTLFPPFRRRIPRSQAGTLSGPDRPLPLAAGRRGAGHAQHPLSDRPRQGGRPRSAAPHDGFRGGMVRGQPRPRRLGAGGDRPAGRSEPPHDGRHVVRHARRGAPDAHGYLRLGPDRPRGVPPQLPPLRILGTRRGLRGLLRNLLRQGLDGLRGRRGGSLLPGRLRAAGHAAAGRRTYRRMEVPRPALGGGRGRDGHLLDAHPAGSRRDGGVLLETPQETAGKRNRRGMRRSRQRKRDRRPAANGHPGRTAHARRGNGRSAGRGGSRQHE